MTSIKWKHEASTSRPRGFGNLYTDKHLSARRSTKPVDPAVGRCQRLPTGGKCATSSTRPTAQLLRRVNVCGSLLQPNGEPTTAVARRSERPSRLRTTALFGELRFAAHGEVLAVAPGLLRPHRGKTGCLAGAVAVASGNSVSPSSTRSCPRALSGEVTLQLTGRSTSTVTDSDTVGLNCDYFLAPTRYTCFDNPAPGNYRCPRHHEFLQLPSFPNASAAPERRRVT
jgi:hypothetical protein